MNQSDFDELLDLLQVHAPLVHKLVDQLYTNATPAQRSTFNFLGYWTALLRVLSSFSSICTLIPFAQIPFAYSLSRGAALVLNDASTPFLIHCPLLSDLFGCFANQRWPVEHLPLLCHIVSICEAPFITTTVRETAIEPFPPEDFVKHGHCYSWGLLRKAKVYGDYPTRGINNTSAMTGDGVCRKKEDKETKQAQRNLIPGIFVCVCRHRVRTITCAHTLECLWMIMHFRYVMVFI
jgi:hypothetical protein